MQFRIYLISDAVLENSWIFSDPNENVFQIWYVNLPEKCNQTLVER